MMPRDPVEEAGLESFPASDPPAWGRDVDQRTPVTDTGSDSKQKPADDTRVDKNRPARKPLSGRVDVVIHSYRHRIGHADGFPLYADVERRLAAQPSIKVPTITLDGDADGVVPATAGKSTAARFSSDRQHRFIAGVGHNLPQENPTAFAAATWELASRTR